MKIHAIAAAALLFGMLFMGTSDAGPIFGGSVGTTTVDTEMAAALAAADAVTNPTTGPVLSFSMGYNGTTWDRLRSTIAGGLVVDTELLTAAALADAVANPTVTSIGTYLLGFNGTTWDRLRSTTANGLTVDVSRVQGTVAANVSQVGGVATLTGNGVTGAGSQRVTIASDNTAFSVNNTQVGTASQNVAQFGGIAVVTGTGIGGAGIPRVTISSDSSLAANQSVNVAQINGVAPTMGNGISGTGVQRVTLASDSTGQVTLAAGAATIGALTANQSVNVAQVNGIATTTGNGVAGTGVQRVAIASDNTAFSVNAAQSGTWTVQPGNTANTTAWLMDQTGRGAPLTGQVSCGVAPATQFGANVVKAITIVNPSTATVYIGPSGITTSTGHALLASGSHSQPVTNTNLFYCVVASGSQTVTWIGSP